eukprot:TRINITY_DN221_c1_g2_i5.p1 TRINITY_DN221_c1_g2~~TRINITY_DN221_c1_g2_i5.p1  ORF type:complete len:618 (-),score=170.53 TRINITY_DN221_c1_g2_i5:180-2033(-)
MINLSVFFFTIGVVIALFIIIFLLKYYHAELKSKLALQSLLDGDPELRPIQIPTYGDPYVVLLKNLWHMLVLRKNDVFRIQDIIKKRGDNKLKMGQIVMVNQVFVQIWDHEVFSEILMRNNHFCKLQNIVSSFNDLFSGSMPFSEEHDWLRQRKVITPCFSLDNLKMLIYIYTIVGYKITHSLKERLNDSEEDYAIVETKEFLSKTIIDLFGLMFINRDFKAVENDFSTKRNNFKIIEDNLKNPLRGIKAYDSNPTSKNVLFTKAKEDFKNSIRKIIRNKENSPNQLPKDILDFMIQSNTKYKIDNNNNDNNNNNNDNESDVNENQSLTENEILKNTLSFMLNNKTPLQSLFTFTLYMLAKHQDIQESLQENIDEYIQEGIPPSYEQIKKLELLLFVIKETMRLFPIVPMIHRRATHDTILNGYSIQAGTIVSLLTYSVHQDHKIWNRPTEFNPQRFSKLESKKRHHFSYIPFGAGARTCVGVNFVSLSVRCILAILLRGYTVSFPNEKFLAYENEDFINKSPSTTINPIDINLIFTPRKVQIDEEPIVDIKNPVSDVNNNNNDDDDNNDNNSINNEQEIDIRNIKYIENDNNNDDNNNNKENDDNENEKTKLINDE